MSTAWDKEDEYEDNYEPEETALVQLQRAAALLIFHKVSLTALVSMLRGQERKLLMQLTSSLKTSKPIICDDPTQEDEDLLVDWSEQFVETRRQSSGSNSKLQTWVDAS